MKKHIVCFGDSNTHGYCADPMDCEDRGERFNENERWTRLLQRKLGDEYLVLEEGLSGRTTVFNDPLHECMSGLDYITPCLMSHEPVDLLIIMLGTNDCKRKYAYSAMDIAWEMQRFLEKVLTHRHFQCADGYQVLLMAPPPITGAIQTSWLGDVFGYDEGRRKSQQLAGHFRGLAARYGCLFLDAGEFAAASDLDGIHLDAENQRKLGEAVARFVKELEGKK